MYVYCITRVCGVSSTGHGASSRARYESDTQRFLTNPGRTVGRACINEKQTNKRIYKLLLARIRAL